MTELTLNIVTPKCTYGPVSCDSIHLTIIDDVNGKGGGSYGIRKGHAKSVFSLGEGVIDAIQGGEVLLVGKSGCGFATVDENVVTVVVETFEKENA